MEHMIMMEYLELLLRCDTRRGLLRAILHFPFMNEYDGVRVVVVLLRRLEGGSQGSCVFYGTFRYYEGLSKVDKLSAASFCARHM